MRIVRQGYFLEWDLVRGVRANHVISVAELTLCFMLGLCRNIFSAGFKLKQSNWDKNGGQQLTGKTVGIIGFGNNGSAFANVLQGFGVKILAYDKYLTDYPFQSNMEEIYKQADIISLHIPLTEETNYLVNNNFINNFFFI